MVKKHDGEIIFDYYGKSLAFMSYDAQVMSGAELTAKELAWYELKSHVKGNLVTTIHGNKKVVLKR